MYYTQMLQIMHIQVSYANQLATTKDIRRVAYFSGTFTAQNKSWCATEKQAYAVLKAYRGLTTTLEVQNVPSDVTINHWNQSNHRHEDS